MSITTHKPLCTGVYSTDLNIWWERGQDHDDLIYVSRYVIHYIGIWKFGTRLFSKIDWSIVNGLDESSSCKYSRYHWTPKELYVITYKLSYLEAGIHHATNLMLTNAGTNCKQEKANCHCHTYAKTGLGFIVSFGRQPCIRKIDNSLSI